MSFKYRYLTLNSIQYYSFACSLLNGSKYNSVSISIQLDNHWFIHSDMVKEFYS